MAAAPRFCTAAAVHRAFRTQDSVPRKGKLKERLKQTCANQRKTLKANTCRTNLLYCLIRNIGVPELDIRTREISDGDEHDFAGASRQRTYRRRQYGIPARRSELRGIVALRSNPGHDAARSTPSHARRAVRSHDDRH